MVAVAVTEPDYGSNAGGVKTTATPATGAGGEPGWKINGVKTWCTFGARADVLMLLARTDPDRSLAHRGLSLFVVPKPRGEGHGFEFTQEGTGGKIEGRAIDTIGYRGMHSYEVSLDGWWGARETASSARRPASIKASTSRWRASRTAACRPLLSPSA